MRFHDVRMFVHLVWSTWDRMPLIRDDVEHISYACMRSECERLGVEILAIGGCDDHVHVLVAVPSTIALADLAQQLKGTSSHLITHRTTCTGFKWQGGYGAYSVSPHDVDAVKAYIARQREHHGISGTGENAAIIPV